MTTILTLLTHLQKTSSVEPREVEILMADVIGKSREFVIAHPEQEIMKNEELRIKNYIRRREEGEPLAYILGHKEFFGYDFLVTPDTLIPRPETEILVEEALEFLLGHPERSRGISPSHSPLCHSHSRSCHSRPPVAEDPGPYHTSSQILDSRLRGNDTLLIDIGTGSGCIITSIAKQLRNFQFPISNFQFLGVDLSEKALEVAKQNANRHHIENDITFLRSNLLEIFLLDPSLVIGCRSLVIITNLPYVPTPYLNEKKTALTQGLTFEPALALDGGMDGFDAYRTLLAQIKDLQSASPALSVQCFFEIGSDQKNIAKTEIHTVFPLAEPLFTNDLAGQVRVVSFFYP